MVNALRNLLFGSLRRRLVFSVLAIQALLMTWFIADLTQRHRSLLLKSQSDHAVATVKTLSSLASGLVATKDLSGLQELVESQRSNPELRFAMFIDTSGQILAHSENERVGQYLRDLTPLEQNAKVIQHGSLLEGFAPVKIGRHHLGWVFICLDQRAVQGRLAGITRDGMLYLFAAVALGSLLAWLLGRMTTRRLSALQSAMQMVQEGNTHARTNLTGTDELAGLSEGFNKMLDRLEQREVALLESKALTEAVVENVPLMIFLKDATELKFVLFNRSGEELIGFDRKDLIGKNDLDFFPPEQAAHFMAKDREVIREGLTVLDIPEESILTARKGQRILHTRKVCLQGADGTATSLLGISEDITERKRAEEDLQQSEQMLQNVLNHFPGVVFWKDTQSSYRGCNEAFSLAAGLKCPSDIVGKTDSDLPWATTEAEKYRKDDSEVMQSGTAKTHIVETQHQVGGQLVWFDTCKLPLRDSKGEVIGVLGVSTDITERKKSEDSLRAAAQYSRNLLETSLDPLVTISAEGRITDVNTATERITGVGREVLIGSDFAEYFTDPGRAREGYQNVFTEGLVTDYPLAVRHASGSVTDVVYNASVYRDEQGKVLGVFAAARDITVLKKAEEEKLRLQVMLQQSQKMESLGSLAGGVAHDMNNILGAILGLASAHLGGQPAGTPLHDALATICKATERGGKMVKSLLTFARQAPVEECCLDLNAIIKDQASLLERTTLARIQVLLDLDAGLHPILGDASALNHAIMNLCVNAVDAMPDNGTLTLRTRNRDSDWVEVVVQDTGEGMSKEVLERALDPFFTTKQVGKGTGLGLSLVYSTVKAHRGHLEIQSEPGRGTLVMICLPACDAGTTAKEPQVFDAEVAPHGSRKVLLVDDDELIRFSVQAILEALGHQVGTASSGEETLKILEGGYAPDLVILDMNMPGLGGAGTLPLLRALRPNLPVLLSTGRVDQTALALTSAYPGVTLLSKPFGLRELQQLLETHGLG